jgi:hypothetical protein
MAVTMYNAVREFMSRRYPKKGKKGIGNKNSNHNPPIKRMNFHLSLSLVYNILMISFNMDLLRDIELLIKKLCFSNGKSLLQLRLVVFPSLGHQSSLPGGTLHERPFHQRAVQPRRVSGLHSLYQQ